MLLVPPPVTWTPTPALPLTTLRAAADDPPTVFCVEPDWIRMPSPPLPTAAVPAALRPMRLPWIAFPLAAAPVTRTPAPVLPLITFPAPAAVPPRVTFGHSI